MIKSDALAFTVGFGLSLLAGGGIYLYCIWDMLYPSLVDIDYGWATISAFACVIPGMLFMLANLMIRDS